jgi:hypothetical protein
VCPAGLHFDAQLLQCSYPEVANCVPCSDDLSGKGGGGAGGSGGEGCLGKKIDEAINYFKISS